MSLNEVESNILELASEDYYGLWEVCWKIQRLRPKDSAAEVRKICINAVRDLVQRGLIHLMRRRGPAGKETLLSENEILNVLNDVSSWEEPFKDSIQFLVGATEEGKEVYYSTFN